MFKQFKNIDTAFRHIKRFSLFFMLANVLIICYGIYTFARLTQAQNDKVYILYNGKLLQALSTDRKSNLKVEIRDHIKTFHQYFFDLTPDEKAITATVTRSFYLADESAKKSYDNLREQGYYNKLIAANISQEISVDSTLLDLDTYPYQFTCFSTQKIVRSSSTTHRRLVTRGEVRDLKIKTDENPHGFLIQNWETLENVDQPVKP